MHVCGVVPALKVSKTYKNRRKYLNELVNMRPGQVPHVTGQTIVAGWPPNVYKGHCDAVIEGQFADKSRQVNALYSFF